MRVSSQRRLLRSQFLILLGVMGCDATTQGQLAACLPFQVPGLSTDAGPAQVIPLTGGPFDAAGFFEAFDGGLGVAGDRCGTSAPCDQGQGLDCVEVAADISVCLPRCGGGESCPDGRTCDDLASGRYCLAVAARGSACEVGSCPSGTRCLVARSEGGRVLASTCQAPCDPDAPSCAAGESCVPGAGGQLETAGACPCSGSFACSGADAGNLCLREQWVCGTLAPLGNPALLGRPSSWDPGTVCDPGTAQRYCGGALDGGTPVYCAQGGSPASGVDGGFSPTGVTGICVAVCQDPSLGVQHPCPTGLACNTTLQALFDVAPNAAVCTTAADCAVAADEVCAGPLPAFGNGHRCARPYGLCAPQ
jgi:hypothetical protein